MTRRPATGPAYPALSAAALAASLAAATLPGEASAEERAPWSSGAYSFSDELGGFIITGVTGSGTKDDPFVITEELLSASPVTMVIRSVRPIRPFDSSGEFASGFLHVQVEITNNSRLPWIEFEFELQERLHEPSTFGDGLSFDQRRSDAGSIGSTTFGRFERDFEPFDRLRFLDGKVDHGQVASFGFLISDFTPRWEFYLVQDPRIPSS